MAPMSCAEKNRRPSASAVMARAPQPAAGIVYSPMILPFGAMRPILLARFSVNQRSPSGATATPRSEAFGVLTGNSLIRPCASMRPSALPRVSTNQMLPSGCAATARRADRPAVGRRPAKFGEAVIVSIEPADLPRAILAKPEIAVGPDHDQIRPALRRRNPMQNDFNVGHQLYIPMRAACDSLH